MELIAKHITALQLVYRNAEHFQEILLVVDIKQISLVDAKNNCDLGGQFPEKFVIDESKTSWIVL
jgi:hypothetical protein